MQIKNQKKGSIMLVVVILATSIMILFLTVSSLAKEYRDQIGKLAYGIVAQYAAESAAEEAIVRYFENSEKKYNGLDIIKERRENVFYSRIKDKSLGRIINEDLSTNKMVVDSKIIINFLDNNIGESIVGINHVGDVSVSASRLVEKVSTRINPFGSYEFRLTAEEREIDGNWNQNDIKQLKLTWSLPNGNPVGAGLEIIQARWPLSQQGNTQTHRIQFTKGSARLETGSYIFGDLGSKKIPNEAVFNLPSDSQYESCDDCLEIYEYIFIFKASVYPIILTIEGINDGDVVKLPDRYAYFKTEAKIGGLTGTGEYYLGGEDIYKSYYKAIESKKEIYTNYDSNFDYARNFMIF